MTTGLIVAVVLGLLVAVGAGVAVVALVGGGLAFRSMSGPKGPTREEMLAEVGYSPFKGGEHLRTVSGAKVVFSEKSGWKWTVQLPRYATLTLQVEERSSGRELTLGRPFESEHAELDARFLLGSEMAVQTVALLKNKKVANAMLAMPYLSMRLKGDELVFEDPNRTGAGGKDAAAAVEAEKEAHLMVAAIITSLFGSLYAFNGTLLPEHR